MKQIKTIETWNDKESRLISEPYDIIEYLEDVLPHGSGIDSTWNINYNPNNGQYYCSNSYHAMDDDGYYAGWYDFTLTFKVHDMHEYKPCNYCKGKGFRDVLHIMQYHKEKTYNEMIVYLQSTGINPNSNGTFDCNYCKGKGKLDVNQFELIRLNFHGAKLPYGLRDYLEELFYDVESNLKFTAVYKG